jgi:hypothetical protein
MKKTTNRRLLTLSAITTLVVLFIFAGLFARIEQPRPITQLEATLASLPLGVSATEADNHMGSTPDSVSETRGVLISPVTMLSPENELAAKYEPPQDFTIRKWSRDGISAVVAIDTTGKVAGRWSWRPRDTK